MDELLWETPQEINLALAKRISVIRKRKKITQQQLSLLSGVSLGSIKRFERTGDISLNHLTNIALCLGVEGEIKNLFTNTPYQSIEDKELRKYLY